MNFEKLRGTKPSSKCKFTEFFVENFFGCLCDQVYLKPNPIVYASRSFPLECEEKHRKKEEQINIRFPVIIKSLSVRRSTVSIRDWGYINQALKAAGVAVTGAKVACFFL